MFASAVEAAVAGRAAGLDGTWGVDEEEATGVEDGAAGAEVAGSAGAMVDAAATAPLRSQGFGGDPMY